MGYPLAGDAPEYKPLFLLADSPDPALGILIFTKWEANLSDTKSGCSLSDELSGSCREIVFFLLVPWFLLSVSLCGFTLVLHSVPTLSILPGSECATFKEISLLVCFGLFI